MDKKMDNGMDKSEKLRMLAMMKAAKKRKSDSKKYVPSKKMKKYPWTSVPENDPYVKNQTDFLMKQAEMNKKNGGY